MTITPSGTPTPMRVTATAGLLLRAAPNTSGAVIAKMPFGEVVNGYSDGAVETPLYLWRVVKRAGGEVGYAADRWLAAVSAPAPANLFIDVSSNNGVIDWRRAYAAGVRHAYVRSTMGGAGVDTQLANNARGALDAGVVLGSYHLFRPDADGVPQAKHAIHQYRGTGLPLAVDVERVVAPQRELSKAQYADQLAAFMEYYLTQMGSLPAVYTSFGEWGALVGTQHDALFGQCALWIANYTTAPKPTLARCWNTYWLWQFSSSGRIDGVPSRVDLNRLKAE